MSEAVERLREFLEYPAVPREILVTPIFCIDCDRVTLLTRIGMVCQFCGGASIFYRRGYRMRHLFPAGEEHCHRYTFACACRPRVDRDSPENVIHNRIVVLFTLSTREGSSPLSPNHPSMDLKARGRKRKPAE